MEFNLNKELNDVLYASYPEIFQRMHAIQEKYNDMPAKSIMNAWGKLGGLGGGELIDDASVQNKRVKRISSSPIHYPKNEVAEMLKYPSSNEKGLREVEKSLEYSAYPLIHTRMVYQNLLTYHWMFTPDMVDEKDIKKKDFWREYKLLCKIGKKFDLSSFAHEVTGQALQEGKVFYYPRYMVDKVHNKVVHAFMQQLPSDYCKIVGFNNKSKYTVAFNMMYFCECGTDPRQFGDLFEDYVWDFNESLRHKPKGIGTRLVYASKNQVNLSMTKNNSNVDAYYQNGKWFYWVVLPVDEVFTFEIDDTNRNVLSPFSGLFIDMIQLSQLEAIQLELLQNPLVSVLTGEIPYWDTKDTNTADQFKLSNGGRVLFETLWYNMLSRNNTGGIGLYAAPLKDMRLHSLAESPSAMDIVSKGYTDMMSKAGLTAIIPVDADARAGAVNKSLMIESKFCQSIYSCIDRMMTCIIEKLRLKYEWEFKMFGDIATDDELEKSCISGMTLGILPAAITYNALHGRTLLDDKCLSETVVNSEVYKNRIPLKSTYTSSGDTDNLNDVNNDGGRPESEDASSEGKEADTDSLG